ncbi:Uu.00g113580.m01.CDS01 [Anthostomella pinea]|uniref:Uu.00g113580.m01.CDS01 n=1 Tax=Anthostomella pinea TaxID=933095 RepID=A0AAI8VFG0_9PEZI|nr:Uu.00g113580.m01.CDS01 [Anthostomella pinea]
MIVCQQGSSATERFFLPIYFQGVVGTTVASSGIYFLPTTIGIPLFAAVGGVLLGKFGAYWPIHATAFALSVIGYGLFTILDYRTPKVAWAFFQLIASAGLGPTLPVSTTLPAILAVLPEPDVASATAVFSSIKTYGFTWGVTTASIIFNAVLDNNLSSIESPALRNQLASGGAYSFASRASDGTGMIDDTTLGEVRAVYTRSLNAVWWFGLGISISSLVVVLCFVTIRPEFQKLSDTIEEMDATEAIEALRRALPDARFAQHGSPDYDELNHFYQSGLCSDITPACIVQPATVEEVATFVKTIKPFSLSGRAPFAIVGRGQQPDGITLSLQRLKGIDVKDGVVQVGAGETWGPVYDKLGEAGLGFSGGRSYRSGIGGLALAGGLSFVSSREGFISDNVLNSEVVLASGSIVNANARENPDLWVALRGGGNNLGVVTRFDFPLVAELRKPDASKETHLMVSIGYTAMMGPQMMCLNQVDCTQGIDKSPVLQPFTDIQPQIERMNSVRMHSLAEAAREQAGDRPSPSRSLYMNTTVKANVATLKAATKIYSAAIEPLKSCKDILLFLTLQPYPLSLLQKSTTQGGNVLGLEPELGPLVSILFLTFWESKEDHEMIEGVLREALEAIDRDAKAKGTAVPFKYLNYAAGFQHPVASYGGMGVERLHAASRRFDPDGLFQKGVPGGWKLPALAYDCTPVRTLVTKC